MKAKQKLAASALMLAAALAARAPHAEPAAAARDVRIAAIPHALHTTLPAQGLRLADDGLSMTAPHGTDMFVTFDGKEVVDNVARVLFQPEGDFILSARVGAGFHKAFDGAGLVVYADRTHWAKLLFEQNKVTGGANVTSTVSMGAGDDAQNGFVAGDAVYLKVVRKDTMVVFYTSPDGKDWTMVRTFGFPSKLPLQAGMFAQSPNGDSYTAQFSQIRYRPVAFKDYWQGE